jgi:hypothetical protein
MQLKHATMYTRLASSWSHWLHTVLSVTRTTHNLLALMSTMMVFPLKLLWKIVIFACWIDIDKAGKLIAHISACSLLHWIHIDKAGKLIAHISACQTIKLITHDSIAKAGKLIASLDLYWQGWQAHCPCLCLQTDASKEYIPSHMKSVATIFCLLYKNTLLGRRIYMHICIYVYPKENNTYIPVWVHDHTSLDAHIQECDEIARGQDWTPSSGTSEALVKSVSYHRKKKASQLSPGISACIFCTWPRMERATHVTRIAVTT